MNARNDHINIYGNDPCGGCHYAPTYFEMLWPLTLAFILGAAFAYFFIG